MTPEEMKNTSRGYSVDMSPEALARRLRIASDLSAMARRMAKAKNLGPVEPRTDPRSASESPEDGESEPHASGAHPSELPELFTMS